MAMEKTWYFLLSQNIFFCFGGGSGSLISSKRQHVSIDHVNANAKPFFQQKFAKIRQDLQIFCQYLPIFANIRQVSPSFAKAVAPTGVSGVDG